VVVDGLGHGPAAAEAAGLAINALAGAPDLAPEDALHLCHRSLAGTRGAAVALAAISAGGARLAYAGVGNVEARLWRALDAPSGQPGVERVSVVRLISYRGIVGVTMPRVRTFDYTLASRWCLLMHTDGVMSRFDAIPPAQCALDRLQQFVDDVLHGWRRPNDDATVVAACSAAEAPTPSPRVPRDGSSE
jgi:hypothetical protein